VGLELRSSHPCLLSSGHDSRYHHVWLNR
jgi:hypothetical protein